MANKIYLVTYQVHKPDTNIGDTAADVYRNAPVEVLVVAPGQDQQSLSTVINGNITLNAGEVYDILQVEEAPFGSRPIYQ